MLGGEGGQAVAVFFGRAGQGSGSAQDVQQGVGGGRFQMGEDQAHRQGMAV